MRILRTSRGPCCTGPPGPTELRISVDLPGSQLYGAPGAHIIAYYLAELCSRLDFGGLYKAFTYKSYISLIRILYTDYTRRIQGLYRLKQGLDEAYTSLVQSLHKAHTRLTPGLCKAYARCIQRSYKAPTCQPQASGATPQGIWQVGLASGLGLQLLAPGPESWLCGPTKTRHSQLFLLKAASSLPGSIIAYCVASKSGFSSCRRRPLEHLEPLHPGYLKAIWPDLLGAFLRSGRPRGPGKTFKHAPTKLRPDCLKVPSPN